MFTTAADTLKRTTLFLIFIILPFFVFALTPDRIVLETGNDLFSMGLSRNDDDCITFSLNSEVSFGLKKIRVDYSSFINRGWKEGWSVKDESSSSQKEFYNGRFDELRVVASHAFVFQFDNFDISVAPGLGLNFTGNLGSEVLQNNLHRIMDIHSVSVPYENSLKLLPVFTLDAELLPASVALSFVPAKRVVESLAIKAPLYNIDLELGYRFTQCFSDSKTDALCCDCLNGPFLNIGFNGDVICGRYTAALSSGFGFGQIGFNVMGLFDKTVSESPVTYALGLRKQLGSLYKTAEVNYRLSDNLYLTVSDSFTAGDPVSKEYEYNADLSKQPRVKQNNAFFTAGVEYLYDFKGLSPNASALAGVYKTELTELYTTVIDSTVPCKTLDKSYVFCAELRGGIQKTVTPNLGVNLFAGVTFISASDRHFCPFYGFSLVQL